MKTLGAGSVAIGAALTLFALTASPAFANGAGHGGGGGGGGGHASFGGHSSAGGRSFGGGAHFARAPSFRGAVTVAAVTVATVVESPDSFRRPRGRDHSVCARGRRIRRQARRRLRRQAGGSRFGGGVGGRYGGRWGGGYWHGGFWPGVFWGGSFAWFLPVLPGVLRHLLVELGAVLLLQRRLLHL